MPALDRKDGRSGSTLAAPLFSRYRPELDILRFVAFFAVFVSHTLSKDVAYYARYHLSRRAALLVATFSRSCTYGVTLFFCLSSFLITTLLVREIASRGALDVRAFYLRRILRIWPLYFSFTIIAVLLPLVDERQKFGPGPFLAFLLFSGNWIWALGFDVRTVAWPLWSVSVEEQFYLVWPWVVRRSSPRRIRILSGVMIAVSIGCRFLKRQGLWKAGIWTNTFAILDPIAWGAFLAVLPERLRLPSRSMARWTIMASALALVFVLTLALTPAEDITMPAGFDLAYPLISLLFCIVLWATLGKTVDPSKSSVRTAVYLGKISYGLYVFHSLGITYMERLAAHTHPAPSKSRFAATCLGALLATVLLAAASYRWLELPFLRLKERFARVRSRETERTSSAPGHERHRRSS